MVGLGVVLVGFGEQARRFYHRTLQELADQHPLRLSLVIDLASQATALRTYLDAHTLQPERVVLLDPKWRHADTLAPEAEAALDDLVRRQAVDRLMVITEPKSHKPYVRWGTAHGVDVLCEKPLTAVAGLAQADETHAWRLYADYLEIAESIRRSRVVLMAPRRLHAGFRFVVDYLAQFLARYEVPITYVDVYHAEGVWNMPDEFETRENHPYRYGYGKLLHSGYHHVDLAARIASLNDELPGTAPDHFELAAQATMPADFFAQFDGGRYAALMATDRFRGVLDKPASTTGRLGETDVQVMGQFRRDGRVITNLQMSLLHTSVNTRSWSVLPDDLAQNGRLPHERLTVHVGHLLTLELTSRYTARAEGRTDTANPFVIRVFRNSGVVGGPPMEEIRIGDGNAAHLSEAARKEIVRAWLVGEPVDAELADHGEGVRMMSMIYASLARRRAGVDRLVGVRWGRNRGHEPVPVGARAGGA